MKEWQHRRRKSKDGEGDGRSHQKQDREKAKTGRKLLSKQHAFHAIPDACGKKEEENIQPVWGFSESAVVGIEEDRDCGNADKRSYPFYPPKSGGFFFEEGVLNQRKNQHGEKEDFHMLPG